MASLIISCKAAASSKSQAPALYWSTASSPDGLAESTTLGPYATRGRSLCTWPHEQVGPRTPTRHELAAGCMAPRDV